MIGPHLVVQTFLEREPTLTSYIGERLFAGRERPPDTDPGTGEPYRPGDQGPSVCFKVRGGDPDYSDALLNVSMQFACFAATEAESYEVYRALYDVLHNARSADILFGQTETIGQPMVEADTGWYFTFAAFRIMLRQQEV